MPCYHPVPAWYGKRNPETGKRGIVFGRAEGVISRLEVPCGKCIGCQLEKSRQWAVRCAHEARMYERNCFVTLTYDDDHLPKDGSLRPADFVGFMKRLRWHFGEGIRFFHCGEYGALLQRPHHHALLFNHDFADRRFYKEDNGVRLYESKDLETLWENGMCTVGEATFESAAYIARYTLKKVVGADSLSHYQGRIPEYLTMSRMPGIGRGFVEKFRNDIYRHDRIVIRGHPCKPVRYYDSVLEKHAPTVLRKIKARRRREAADKQVAEEVMTGRSYGSRLYDKEEVKEASVTALTRCLENTHGA